MGKKIKVLYTCPNAHYSGHHPHVATVEPVYLKNNGFDVGLLTFCGILTGVKPDVNNYYVVNPKTDIVNPVLFFSISIILFIDSVT